LPTAPPSEEINHAKNPAPRLQFRKLASLRQPKFLDGSKSDFLYADFLRLLHSEFSVQLDIATRVVKKERALSATERNDTFAGNKDEQYEKNN
jgi:hypothetical protein